MALAARVYFYGVGGLLVCGVAKVMLDESEKRRRYTSPEYTAETKKQSMEKKKLRELEETERDKVVEPQHKTCPPIWQESSASELSRYRRDHNATNKSAAELMEERDDCLRDNQREIDRYYQELALVKWRAQNRFEEWQRLGGNK